MRIAFDPIVAAGLFCPLAAVDLNAEPQGARRPSAQAAIGSDPACPSRASIFTDRALLSFAPRLRSLTGFKPRFPPLDPHAIEEQPHITTL
jgi:hypothetical protein